jgi:hypothetical protein
VWQAIWSVNWQFSFIIYPLKINFQQSDLRVCDNSLRKPNNNNNDDHHHNNDDDDDENNNNNNDDDEDDDDNNNNNNLRLK